MNLRVLFIEDSIDDTQLVLRRLRQAGIEARWERVETEAALCEALAGARWDLAVVDYNLPGFGGPQALVVLADTAPDLPAITVSGAISEDTAVATLTAGAVDYVLKDNLIRLAPAVQRAVEGAELRRRQRRFREQARQSQFAVDHASQAILYVDEDGVLLYVNEAAERLGGVPRQDAVGREIWSWIPTVDRRRWDELWAAAAERPIVDFETLVRHVGGEDRVVKATIDHLERDGGAFVIIYARDITEQRLAEERADETEARYRRLTDNAADIIFRYDLVPRPGLTYINPAVEAITGYTPQECYADPQLMLTMIHPDDAPAMAGLLKSLEPPDEPLLLRWIGSDGVTRWMESRVAPVRDAGGRLVAIEGITRDVTERKRAEDALRESETHFRAFFEQASIGMATTSLEKGWLETNDTLCAMLGYSRQELHRTTWAELTFPDDLAADEAQFQRLVAGEIEGYALDKRFVRKDGGIVHTHLTVRAVRDPGGDRGYLAAVLEDITERQEAQEDVRRHAERLRRTLEGTVLAMSHVVETRDPYTAGHERRVAEFAVAIAFEMGVTGDQLDGLRLAGLIHDIGKIAVPAEILARPGRLSAVEFDLIKQHAQSGHDILAAVEFDQPVARIVLQHHERLDGSGYPQGLTGEDILPEARILAVADVVEAMSSHRPYRAALGMEPALAEIRENAGVKYDAEVAAACLRVVEERGFAFTE